MKIITPGFEFMQNVNGNAILKSIERAGRVCYKSEALITDDSAASFVRGILKSGHESVIEHEKITCKIICDRGVSHEIVRHRLASYSQESTRYCNYSKEKFGSELTFVRPFFWREDSEAYKIWLDTMRIIESNYIRLIESGAKAEEARSILPNSLKTEIVVSMDLREWRHFFRLRTSSRSHPQMREIALPMLAAFREKVPVVFDNCSSE